MVDHWPAGAGDKVPSLFSYAADYEEGNRWGYDTQDGAYTLRWTKTELASPVRLDALIALRQTLSDVALLNLGHRNAVASPIPRHLSKTAEDIATDYLTMVAMSVREDIQRKENLELLRRVIPVDLVITHPAVSGSCWSHGPSDRSPELISKFRIGIIELKADFLKLRLPHFEQHLVRRWAGLRMLDS